MIYDLTFFIMINIIILNIVFGVIIDTFGEMRDEALQRSETLENNCLICLNSKQSMENQKVDFEEHKERDHNIWIYVYYIKYLKEKPVDELTLDEYKVWQIFKNQSAEWMPKNSTLFFNDPQSEQQDVELNQENTSPLDERISVTEKLNSLEETMKTLVTEIKQLKKVHVLES